ncbi:cyclic nucleotide-binding domain-containing protein [Pseudomonas aeruginosa]
MSKAQPSTTCTALERLFQAYGKKRSLKKNEQIIPLLENPKRLYLVVQGSMRVSLSNPGGDGVMCINHLKPGDMFGEQGAFDSAPMQYATASIQARCKVELLCITHDELKRATLNSPSIYRELSAHINTRLGETTDKLLQLLFDDLDQRCYKSLVGITRLPDALTHPDGMQISLTRIELAQMAGCARESAGRAIKRLRDQGLIEVRGSKIVVRGIRHGLPFDAQQRARTVCA